MVATSFTPHGGNALTQVNEALTSYLGMSSAEEVDISKRYEDKPGQCIANMKDGGRCEHHKKISQSITQIIRDLDTDISLNPASCIKNLQTLAQIAFCCPKHRSPINELMHHAKKLQAQNPRNPGNDAAPSSRTKDKLPRGCWKSKTKFGVEKKIRESIIADIIHGTEPTVGPQPRFGIVYILFRPGDRESVKIGVTEDPVETRRKHYYETHCGITLDCFGYSQRVEHCHRFESLVHSTLKHWQKREPCQCSTRHREWFDISPEKAMAIIKHWEEWMLLGGYKGTTQAKKWHWDFEESPVGSLEKYLDDTINLVEELLDSNLTRHERPGVDHSPSEPILHLSSRSTPPDQSTARIDSPSPSPSSTLRERQSIAATSVSNISRENSPAPRRTPSPPVEQPLSSPQNLPMSQNPHTYTTPLRRPTMPLTPPPSDSNIPKLDEDPDASENGVCITTEHPSDPFTNETSANNVQNSRTSSSWTSEKLSHSFMIGDTTVSVTLSLSASASPSPSPRPMLSVRLSRRMKLLEKLISEFALEDADEFGAELVGA